MSTAPKSQNLEVKAMKGTLSEHPVGMSRSQFEMAQAKGSSFWLYIVENATSPEPHLLKIQDPVGHIRTYTFSCAHTWTYTDTHRNLYNFTYIFKCIYICIYIDQYAHIYLYR